LSFYWRGLEDFEDYERIVLRVRSNGQPFLFHIKTESFMLNSDMFQIAFKTKPDRTWCHVKVCVPFFLMSKHEVFLVTFSIGAFLSIQTHIQRPCDR
jgi:hypothetical protein